MLALENSLQALIYQKKEMFDELKKSQNQTKLHQVTSKLSNESILLSQLQNRFQELEGQIEHQKKIKQDLISHPILTCNDSEVLSICLYYFYFKKNFSKS